MKIYRRGGLAPNAISQPFDKNSSGFVRSEAVCILFLQKHHKANRVYAEILHSRTINDGYKREGPPFPSLVMQKELYSKVYSEANIDPNDVDFLEAHATSTHIGDKYEVTSIDEFFCKNRDRPLKVGSVKGNTGHTEGASGAVSLVKAILMFENGKTIPNINITELRDDCPGIVEKRMKVVQEVEDFDGKIIGVNNFGVVGANAHTILARNEKVKVDGGFPTDDLPRLLLWSGRTLDAVNTIFNEVLSKPIDDEFLALLQNSQIIPMSITRPIVFVYAGMGSQWLEMGKDLLKIPLIAESIEKCHQVLLNHNLDLKHILTSNDPNTFSNCLNISVGITSIQIALTNLLFKIGIKPNNFIGHSIGELACAYADGTLTLEQTILLALSRGQAIIEGMEKPGAMAAVAMTYDELQKILPNDIEIACHNAEESCTISGPIESVENFVKEIKSKQILAKIVDTCNVAYHSSLIAKSGPILTQKLRKIITEPKKRSSKWIPTGIVNEKDDYSSIEYHVNNVIGPVRFAEGVSKLPKDSLMIEIAPHGLLQPLLKQLNPGGVCFSLTQRGVEDGVINLLQSIGRIYQTGGVEIDIRQMYPKINYPVSRGTPMISPLIRWLHDESIAVPMYDPLLRCDKRNIVINLGEKKYSFMKGHEIDGKFIEE
jgi:fatty acid synthase, animal type